jgi:hypothetical protein
VQSCKSSKGAFHHHRCRSLQHRLAKYLFRFALRLLAIAPNGRIKTGTGILCV